MKNIKKIIILAICVFTIGGFLYINLRAGKTTLIKDDEQGNTPGNLYNNGLFCEQGNRIYFSNLADDGALYSVNSDLTDYQKISTDKVVSINVTEPYIIYSRRNNQKKQNSTSSLTFNKAGVYRIDKDGKNLVRLDDTPAGIVSQHGNMVYYQHYDKKNAYSLYSVTISGENASMIEGYPITPAMIANQKMYYAGYAKDKSVFVKSLSTNENEVLIKGTFYMPIIQGEKLYYIAPLDNYKLKVIDLNSKKVTTLLKNRCSTYNITNDGKYIYYQVDDGKNNGIGYVDTKTLQSTPLLSGDYCNINITSDHVFFQVFKKDQFYSIKIGGAAKAEKFNPEIAK